MNCLRCTSPMPEDAPEEMHLCSGCAPGLQGRVDPQLMAELTRYWERRLLEGREKDWT